MTDGSEVENRLSSLHDEQSKTDLENFVDFDNDFSPVSDDPMGGWGVIGSEGSWRCAMGGRDQKYVVISLHNCNQDTDSYTLNKLHYISTDDTNNPINDNTKENNENNKDINSDNHNTKENKENNKEINSDNHNQIIQNTIINKKRKRIK